MAERMAQAWVEGHTYFIPTKAVYSEELRSHVIGVELDVLEKTARLVVVDSDWIVRCKVPVAPAEAAEFLKQYCFESRRAVAEQIAGMLEEW